MLTHSDTVRPFSSFCAQHGAAVTTLFSVLTPDEVKTKPCADLNAQSVSAIRFAIGSSPADTTPTPPRKMRTGLPRELANLSMEAPELGMPKREASRRGSGQGYSPSHSASPFPADTINPITYGDNGRPRRNAARGSNGNAEASGAAHDQRSSSIIRESTPIVKSSRSKVREATEEPDKEGTNKEKQQDVARQTKRTSDGAANARDTAKDQPLKRGRNSRRRVIEESDHDGNEDDGDEDLYLSVTKKKAANKRTAKPRARPSKGKKGATLENEAGTSKDQEADGEQLASVGKRPDARALSASSALSAKGRESVKEHADADVETDGDSDASFEVVGYGNASSSLQPFTGPQDNVDPQGSALDSEAIQEAEKSSAGQKGKRGLENANKSRRAPKKQKPMPSPATQDAEAAKSMTALQKEVAQKSVEAARIRDSLAKQVQARVNDQIFQELISQSAANLRLESYDLDNIQISFEIQEDSVELPAEQHAGPQHPVARQEPAEQQPAAQAAVVHPIAPPVQQKQKRAKVAFAVQAFDDQPSARNSFRPHERLDVFLMTKIATKADESHLTRTSHAEFSSQTENEHLASARGAGHDKPTALSILGASTRHVEQEPASLPFYPRETHPYYGVPLQGQVSVAGIHAVEKHTDGEWSQSSVATAAAVRGRKEKKDSDRSERRKGR